MTVGAPISLEVRAWTAAAPAAVYALVADGATWPAWTPVRRFRLERDGNDGGQTVGAVRVFGIGPGSSREEITELRPDAQVSYRLLGGLPVHDHRADVVLTPSEGGTAIVWCEAFVPNLPGTGWALRWFLTAFVRRCAKGLAAYAPRAASPA